MTHVSMGGASVADSWNVGGTLTLDWRHTNPVTGDEIDTDAAGAVVSKATVDPAGVNVGDIDSSASDAGSGEGESMSQSQMNRRYAQLLPPSLGGDALQAVEKGGFQINAATAFSMAAMGAGAVIFSYGDIPSGMFVAFVNHANGKMTHRWAPLTAVGDWAGYLPAGAKLGNDGVSSQFRVRLDEIAKPDSPNHGAEGVFDLGELPGGYTAAGLGLGYSPQRPEPLRPQDDNERIRQGELIDEAFTDAGTALLRDSKCRRFLNLSKSQVNSFINAVLHNADTGRLASDVVAITNGTGKSAGISLGALFFSNTEYKSYDYGPRNARQWRALTILHEFAHAQRRIPDDGDATHQNTENDKKVFGECMRGIASLPTMDEPYIPPPR